jgi:ADP-ribose pyrophosphatase YjhB (NUDIX family)
VSQRSPRAVALGVFRRGQDVLVNEGHDRTTGEHFCRPPGGGIEFGERGREALGREMLEELGVRVHCMRRLGTLENIFTFEGRRMHEILLVYEARMENEQVYRVERLRRLDKPARFAVWAPVRDFTAGERILYPTGLLSLLTAGGRESESLE